jgi:hypothetical protein
MTDYLNMTTEQLSELERVAYAAGDTDKAALIAALLEVVELADKAGELESDLESLKKETEDYEQYRDFFRGCFERLDGHYPAPSVTSDYDCSVIFDAITKGGEMTE